MRVSCPDLESSQKLDLDTGWTIPFRRGHLITDIWFSHIWNYSENFKYSYLDLDSHQRMDLDAIWTILVGDPFLTPPYTPNTISDIIHVTVRIK